MKSKWQEAAFLYRDEPLEDVFIPENKTEDQAMIAQMVNDFVSSEREKSNLLEHQVDLMKKAGELGLLNAHISAEYGGMELDTNTNTIISERIGKMSGSFNTTFAAHIGIGMLPIYFFGNDAQKKKYLVPLGQGQKIVSYCLTEPNAGSDALSGKTSATLSEDGEAYLINGQKMWISNAGFADIFVVFAKIDQDKLTGFIVEANSPGITLGEEEHKMGIKGSSTRQIFFENCRVPKENILGKIGKGHRIAFNVLNIGRFKLGTMSSGGCKGVLGLATQYANERFQFNVPIAKFGAIQHKLAEMTTRIFALDSAVFRVSEWMGNKKEELEAEGASKEEAALKSAMEYAMECAIIKIYGSESISYAVDENVQVHGGMGYSEEGETARLYRDARINKIYEGTNEINRLIIIKQLLKGAEKGENEMLIHSLPWLQGRGIASCPDGYTHEQCALWSMKEAMQYVVALCMEAQMKGVMDLRKNQFIALALADMVIDILMAESTWMRVEKLLASETYDASLIQGIRQSVIFQSNRDFMQNGQDILQHILTDSDVFESKFKQFNDICFRYRADLFALRRQIAKVTIDSNGYPFE